MENCLNMKILLSHKKNIVKLQKLVQKNTIDKLKIKRISKRRFNGKVYDICVSETNSYSLNGVFSSNSSGGSLVSYLLGITELNPFVWGTSFNRFLSPARGGNMLKVSMPSKK